MYIADALEPSDDYYDRANDNDARHYTRQNERIYDVTPATDPHESDYDFVDAGSDFESELEDINHNQIVDLSIRSYIGVHDNRHRPMYDFAYR